MSERSVCVVAQRLHAQRDFYVHIRHAGERTAQKYDSQEEAEFVAAAVRDKITLGEFDIAALKAARAPTVKPEEKPRPLALKDYYEKTIRSLREGSLSRNTGRKTGAGVRELDCGPAPHGKVAAIMPD